MRLAIHVVKQHLFLFDIQTTRAYLGREVTSPSCRGGLTIHHAVGFLHLEDRWVPSCT